MRRRQVLIMVIGMAATALVVLLIVAVFTAATKSTEIRDQQVDRTPAVERNDEILAQIARLQRDIRDCTTPGRPCYERGKRQTAKAVGDINRVVVLAAACASGPTTLTEAEIQACVIQRLSEEPG